MASSEGAMLHAAEQERLERSRDLALTDWSRVQMQDGKSITGNGGSLIQPCRVSGNRTCRGEGDSIEREGL